MSGTDDVIGGVDLTAGEYHVEQALVRNKYAVYDPDGELVLRAKQKLFKAREEFPFANADGEVVFRVKAAGILDIAGDYAVVDERSGAEIVTLRKNFTLLKHSWTVAGPDGRVLAEVRSGSRLLELLRGVSTVLSFLPHSYVITGPNGEHVGGVEGQFSLRDRYDLRIDDPGDAPEEALVAAAIAIDALEGN